MRCSVVSNVEKKRKCVVRATFVQVEVGFKASEAVSGECEEGRWATRPSRPPSENGGWFLTWETKKLGIVCVLLVWFLSDYVTTEMV